jgi:TonB-linked SusC/RagA family outer membrane protein
MTYFLLSKRTTWVVFLISMLSAMQVYSQVSVNGQVTSSSDKSTIPGVSISIKGTTIGTTTDMDGKYSINVPSGDAVLVFSFIGYITEEIRVGTQTNINVSLTESIEQLTEVVFVGYSEKKKSEITGAITSVDSKAIQGVTTPDLGSMLQGKVAGLQVFNATGQPGSQAEIRIRGTSSINADRQALIVVDGIAGGSYNPNDVESVTVLKDAAAISLYGSQANAGVIVITTKRGKTEKPTVNYRGSIGQRKAEMGNFKMMNAQELYATERKMFTSSSTFNTMRPNSVLDNDIDWVGLAYQTALIQNHNVNISGKSKNVGYYVGADYIDEEGTLVGTGFERYNFRSNLDFELSKAARLSTNVNVTRSNGTSYHWRAPYQPLLYLPYDSPYGEDGKYRYVDGNTSGFLSRDKVNTLHSAQYNDYGSKDFSIMGDANLTVDILPWLTFNSRNRVAYSTWTSKTYEDARTVEAIGYGGSLSMSNGDSYSIGTTNLIRLHKDFGSHQLSGFVGFEGGRWEGEYFGVGGIGIVPGMRVMSGVSEYNTSPSGTITEGVSMAVLSELNYNYNEKYFFSGSLRRDGSATFGPENRWGTFGAVSGSWLISSEDFFSDFRETLNSLKLRASWGVVGNDNIGLWLYLPTYTIADQYNGSNASYPSNLPNPKLGWEQTKTFNIGLDASINNRINVSIDYFNKDTDDLLLKVQLPPSQGLSEVWRNVGRIVNNGVELGIDGNILKKSDLTWDFNFNIGTAKNKVKHLVEGSENIYKSADGVKQIITVGEDVNSWYLPKWIGVDPDNGNPLWEKAIVDGDGNVTGYEPTSSYAEASSPQSLQIVGSATPDFFGGLGTSVFYKGFTLNIQTAFSYGAELYHRTRENVDSDGAMFNFNMMQLADGWSRWEKPGDIATHPKLVFGGNNMANKASSRYLEDGSFWRVKNISLSYAIPQQLLSKARISNASVFISADNLFTWTKFSGMDPETSSFGVAGLQDYKYPISKQFLAGVQFSF